jgi:hypothetical protein
VGVINGTFLKPGLTEKWASTISKNTPFNLTLNYLLLNRYIRFEIKSIDKEDRATENKPFSFAL